MDRKHHVTAGAATAVIVLAGGLTWTLVSSLPPAVLKAGTILATVLQPVTFWMGWKLGSRDAKTYLAGVDQGAGAVITAGTRVSKVQAAARRRLREPELPPVELPNVEIVHLSSGGDNEVIDL